MRAVAREMSPPPVAAGDASRGVFVADFDGPLADCAVRAARLLDTPDAVGILHPLLMRESCYWLLRGPKGPEIAKLASSGNASHGVLRAMENLFTCRFAPA